MEIINKNHKDYETVKREGDPYIRFSKDMKRIVVSRNAALEFGIMPGDYLHFANDIDRLYVFFNDDESGAKALKNRGDGLVFWASASVEILKRKNKKITPSAKFILRKSNTSIRESVTLEVLIHNRLNGKKITTK